MSTTDQRKYICDECGDATWFHLKRQKAARPRCRWCGSLALDAAEYSTADADTTEMHDRKHIVAPVHLTEKERYKALKAKGL